jgi:hypothetical protein
LTLVVYIEDIRLTFSFVQVKVAMGNASMGGGSIPPYSFVTTN